MFIITCVGNMTRDPEVREVNGTRVAKFSLATNRKIKGVEHATYLDFEAWGGVVQIIERWKKGSKIQVAGELEQQSWEKDGEKKTKYVVRVSAVKGLVTKEDEDSGESAPQVSAPTNNNDDEVPF